MMWRHLTRTQSRSEVTGVVALVLVSERRVMVVETLAVQNLTQIVAQCVATLKQSPPVPLPVLAHSSNNYLQRKIFYGVPDDRE